jgi:hypothetical protein
LGAESVSGGDVKERKPGEKRFEVNYICMKIA